MKIMDKRKIRWISVILAVILFMGIFGGNIDASERRTVRVAFFPMDGYHITNSDGSRSGMDVVYLNALCEYTNWKIQYVDCDSWEEALEKLEDHKVDLVGSAQYSYERAEEFLYAEIPSGYTFGVIATNPDSRIAYEDFPAMKNITYGMVENYVRKDEFLQYMNHNGIKSPKIIFYKSTSDLQDALSKGEIDALVHSFTEVREGQRLIGRFAPRPFYYITYKGNRTVMDELNQAGVDLKMEQPQLETDLMNRFYYSRFDKTALLTTDEKTYLEGKKNLVVGYLDGFYPFSYEEDGEFKGLTRDLLESGMHVTGVKFSYRKLADRKEAKESLRDGKIDVLAYCTDTEEVLNKYRLKSVCNYAEVPIVLVMEKNRSISDISTLATVSFLQDKVGEAVQTDHVTVDIYDTQQKGMEAVEKGKEDAVLCDGYLAEYLIRTHAGYSHLQIKNVFSTEHSVSMAVRENNELLGGILEKTMASVDSKMVSEYMLKENKYPFVSIADFLRDNSLWLIGFMFVVCVLIILVAVHMVRDGRKIQKLMYKDTKMDIWNLNYLIYWGEHKMLPERNEKYAVVYVNLAQFRRYNVIYGWNAGESLLEGVAGILMKNVDKEDEICARDQGDHFVFLLQYEDAEKFRMRIMEIKGEVEEWILKETDNRMLLQLGIYYLPKESKDLRLAISYANQALDYAGNAKGEEVKVYDEELEEKLKERHEREKVLEAADINRDFVTYYQPKVDIRDGKIVGAEALVRFRDPTDGGKVKAPGYFVPYYEQTGRITEIDFFVYESVCKLLRRRLDEGLPVVTVSCNFSRMHFIRPGFPERFMEVLNRYQISKELIEVEITETMVVEELQYHTVKKNLDTLQDMGIHLSIDDFGSGYSSLGIFEQIPASVVKLDRSFLLNQENRDRQVKIMRGIVKLSDELNAQVVCEGVETQEDVSLMKEIGAYVAQGYFYSRPIPEEEFEKQLETLQ